MPQSKNMIPVIGMTGGVGSGKSALLDELKKNLNSLILKTDDIAKKLKEPGEICYNGLVLLLGREIIGADKYIDNVRMSKLIFENKKLLQKVNEIVHPEVEKAVREIINKEKKADIIFIESALLIEADYKSKFLDELWYVYANKNIRRERLFSSRGYSYDKINKIVSSQLDDEIFRAEADFIIDNSYTLEYSLKQIKEHLSNNIFI